MRNGVIQERLKELINYDPDTGIFTRKVSVSTNARAGDEAGSIKINGYRCVGVDGGSYLAHRLAWLIVYGVWPFGEIDHINGDRLDNRIANLRDVSSRTNAQNLHGALSNNKTGLLGVMPASDHKRGNKYIAQIKVFGKSRHIGTFNTPEEAHEAYLKEKRIVHPGGCL